MPRSVGVSPRAYFLECEKQLENKPVNYEKAKEFIDSICEDYNLPKVYIFFKGSRRNKSGAYYPDCQVIELYAGGWNWSTLVHEMAHHWSRVKGSVRSHDRLFQSKHEELLEMI